MTFTLTTSYNDLPKCTLIRECTVKGEYIEGTIGQNNVKIPLKYVELWKQQE